MLYVRRNSVAQLCGAFHHLVSVGFKTLTDRLILLKVWNDVQLGVYTQSQPSTAACVKHDISQGSLNSTPMFPTCDLLTPNCQSAQSFPNEISCVFQILYSPLPNNHSHSQTIQTGSNTHVSTHLNREGYFPQTTDQPSIIITLVGPCLWLCSYVIKKYYNAYYCKKLYTANTHCQQKPWNGRVSNSVQKKKKGTYLERFNAIINSHLYY